jgi:hypothetical protein
VDVNLQTAEVFLYGRMMVPVDAKLAQFPDFQDVFGTTDLPLCAVVARNKFRDRWVRIYSGGYEYDVQAWKVPSRSYLDDATPARLNMIDAGVRAARDAASAAEDGATPTPSGGGAGAWTGAALGKPKHGRSGGAAAPGGVVARDRPAADKFEVFVDSSLAEQFGASNENSSHNKID